MELKNFLSVVMTTHVLPTAPSVDIITKTINCLRDKFIGIDKCDLTIYCDSKTDNVNSIPYVNNLKNIPNVKVVDIPSGNIGYAALQNNYIKGIFESKTPFIFCCEHDWEFLWSADLTKLVNDMLNYNFINFVRFNKRDNIKSHKDNPPPGDDGMCFTETYVEEELRVKNQPLMKTDSIATHPHIIRKDMFVDNWFDIAKHRRPDVAGAVEANLHDAYQIDIRNMGFQAAHKKWGVYNFGSKYDTRMLSHTDGSDSMKT